MKGLTLIATLGPITREVLGEKGAETSGTFHLSTLLRHVVPDPATLAKPLLVKGKPVQAYLSDFKVAFATTQERRLQWCGQGVLMPNAYVAVGPLVYCQRPSYSKRRDHRQMILDCGIPLHMEQRGDDIAHLPAPYVCLRDLKVGTWLACLGRLYFISSVSSTEMGMVRVRVVRRQILDLRVEAPTFGQIIDWEIGQPLPHDPDEVDNLHTDFYTLEVL